jgi:hypothetical protein
MVLQILSHTPPWVFGLFFILLALGIYQRNDRIVSRTSVTILPSLMIVLSLYGVVSAFGMGALPLAAWLLGVILAGLRSLRPCILKGGSYTTETKSFSVPGSWVPLWLMMAIFCTKYAVGVILARRLPIAVEPVFGGSISLVYGLFGGAFFARAVSIMRTGKIGMRQDLP